jgi:hypothetical protein
MRDAERSDLVNETESPARVSLFGDPEITECGLVFEEQAWQSGFKFVAGSMRSDAVVWPVRLLRVRAILDPLKNFQKA